MAFTEEEREVDSVKQVSVIAWLGAALSVVAIFPQGYGYYIFLRWSLTALAIWISIDLYRRGAKNWLYGLVPIAILWNPIFPFGYPRPAWLLLNLAAAIFLAVLGLVSARERNSEER